MALDLTPVLAGVLSATASRLNEAERLPGLVHIAPGLTVAWDNCCEGEGQLWVRVVDVVPTAGANAPFPGYDTTQRGNCPALLAVQIGLGVVRCVHTIRDDGTPPTGDEMSEDGEAMLLDMGILLDTIQCDVRALPGVLTLKIGRWTPQGPEGGCAGGEWTAFLAVDPCLEC